MTVEKFLTYRGDMKAAVGVGGTLAFVTVHPEGQATGLYRLDAETLALEVDPLPRGGLALVADDQTLWIAGGDGQLYEASAAGGRPEPRGTVRAATPTALALLADARLAVLAGPEVVILARKDGMPVQTLDLSEPGTCLAADPSGRWLAVGTAKGTVAVFEAEDKPEFRLSASGRLHEGAVTALLFETDELRVFSAGADLKLLTTHARGRLEPEDKGRANNHTDAVTALIWGPGDRLYSGSRDGSIKSWPRAGGVKPATTKDGVGRVVALALVDVHERPRLVAACDDNTLRFFPLDAAGKIGESSHRIYDTYARAKHELAQDDPTRREAALRALAGSADGRSVELVAEQVAADADHALRLLAAQMLAESGHPRAATLLEKGLGHPDEAVRVAAFHGLRRHLGSADLRPIDLALQAEKADVGRLAVQALQELAPRDEQALARLVGALDAKTPEVRQAAVLGLETAYDPRSPEADLVALGSKHADVRRAALLRLFQRRMLPEPAVQRALRRRAEDADAEVRRAAFLLSLHTRERLLRALRRLDPDLERQLSELEGAPAEGPPAAKASQKGGALGRVAAQIRALAGRPARRPGDGGQDLDPADFEPLLQATASRALDTCLRGARGLALLGDPRAFGLLLQLSREEDPAARAEVCRALAALDDPRALERLRSLLHDPEAEVRDAAFTALARIHQADPLLASAAGLDAAHEDVRRRGLQELVASLRKAPGDASRQLLARALNDSFPAVRAEAFKTALGLRIAGGGAGTLRFALRSVHPDVRREVLIEAMAQLGETWGWDLLLEFFNDPDPTLRAEAFTVAVKKAKGLAILEAGLGSRHADLRRRAVDELVKKHTAAAQALLARVLEDEDRGVRLAALESLVDADALPALAGALDGPHDDVRLRAATVLAKHGDRRALEPLLGLASAPEPTDRGRVQDWLTLAEAALEGLAELGDPVTVPRLIPLLDSPHATLRKQAIRALVWAARPEALDPLRMALQHDDPQVKYHAALGLVYAGDPSVASLVYSAEAGKVLDPGDPVAAAVALGDPGEGRLIVALDDPAETARTRALLLLLIREWKAPQGTAARCLAALSSRMPRVRLTAARALEVLADPAAFGRFVVDLFNDRGDKPAWKVPAPTVVALAEMLVHGAPQFRARTVRLLRLLDHEEQAALDQAWAVHEARFAEEIATLRDRARTRRPPPLPYTPAQLRELAFGAYVGLVREQGSAKGKKGQPAGSDPQVIRVRETALDRLLALARSDAQTVGAARPVLVQALGDPNQAVRLRAFEHLQALAMDPAALAAEALGTGHTDLGVKGLQLLTGGASDEEGQAVLEQAMLTRTDDLATEAARLLIARRGVVAAAGPALEAAHEPLRRLAVSWLAAAYDAQPTARDQLHRALASRYRAVREAAALELATKKDPAAYEALVALLAAGEPKRQQRAIQALVALGDPRAPGAFLDRIDDDPGGTALGDELLKAVGPFRRPEVADRLLALMDRDRKRREAAFGALLMISGYDQPISDYEDEHADLAWEAQQFPRRHDLLARLVDRVAAPGDARLLSRLFPGARWSRGREVDPVLAVLVNHPDDEARRRAVEALGWRLRKRGGDVEPLRRALQHRDPTTQFVAAEALARAGRADGMNVLLASIDLATDPDVRRRAVLALGELGDERALEPLLKLVGDDGHALQEAAAEAIGHLPLSARGEEVFKLLERLDRQDGGVGEAALRGLRWLDAPAGWQLIRRRAQDQASSARTTAVELLRHNDDPATRDLLLRLLAADEDDEVIDAALSSAVALFGPDSLEPRYAELQNAAAQRGESGEDISLKLVCERGDSRRIFEILPKCPEAVRGPLATSLLNRPELPVAEARAALDGPDPITVRVAAQILGRAGARAADARPALEAALARWRKTWQEKRPALARDDTDGIDLGDALTPCVQGLVWAAGRLGGARRALAEMATDRPDDPEYRPIRREAVLALAEGEMAPEVVAALEQAALGGDPEVRAIAAQALARRAPERAEALGERLLSDRVSFRRLTRTGGVRLEGTLRKAARQVHFQGVVLPELIVREDVAGLAAVAEDRSLPEASRLGAIEALAAMARAPAEDVLRRLGTAADEVEDLRKASWRGLRRSKRARQKAAGTAPAEVRSS